MNTGLGAAGTAAAGPVGAAVGLALGNVVAGLFSGSSSSWTNAGPGVHAWFTSHGSEGFLAFMRGNYPDKFGDLNTVKMLNYVWTRDIMPGANGALRQTANPPYMIDGTWAATVAAFAELGIDLEASDIAQKAEGGNEGWRLSSIYGVPHCNYIGAPIIKMLPGAGTPQVPTVAVDEIARVIEGHDQGGKGSPSDREIIGNLKDGAGVKTASIGKGLLVALVLIWLANRG